MLDSIYHDTKITLKWAAARDFQQCGMCDQQSLRSACAYAQSVQSLCLSLEYSMRVKLLTEHHLVFLSLKGGCKGLSESTLSNCWKSHVTAQIAFLVWKRQNVSIFMQCWYLRILPKYVIHYSGLWILIHGVISLQDTTSSDTFFVKFGLCLSTYFSLTTWAWRSRSHTICTLSTELKFLVKGSRSHWVYTSPCCLPSPQEE